MKANVLMCLLCVGWLAMTEVSVGQDLPKHQELLPGKDKLHAPARDLDGFPLPHGAVARLGTLRLRTTNSASALAFSRDGKRLVSKDLHGVRLWDVESGKELGGAAVPFVAHAVFNHDGSRILLSSGLILDGHDCENLGTYKLDPNVSGLIPHPKDETFAVITRQGKIYRARSDKVEPDSLKLWSEIPERYLNAAAWSNDGKTLGVLNTYGELSLLDAASGKAQPAIRLGRGNERLLFTADDKAVVMMSDGGVTFMSDIATGKTIGVFSPRHGLGAWWLSADGRTLMIGTNSNERVVYQWDIRSSELTQTYKYPNTNAMRDIGMAFSPDGTLAANADGHQIKVWNIRTGKPLVTLPGHSRPINEVCFVTDGRRIVTNSEDGQGAVWDAATGKLLHQFSHDRGYRPGNGFAKDGTILVACNYEAISFFDVLTGKMTGRIQPPPDLLGLDGLGLRDVARSGKTLLLGTRGGVHLWDIKLNKSIHRVQASNPVGHLALSPDERRLAEWWDQSLALWDIPTGKRLWQIKEEETTNPIHLLAFSMDSRQVLVDRGSRRNGDQFVLMDVNTSKPRGSLHCFDTGFQSVAFSRDGRLLATASTEGIVRLWEFDTLLMLGQIVPRRPWSDGSLGQPYKHVRLAFDHTGLRLAMGVDDGSALVYSLPTLFGGERVKFDDKAWDLLASGDGTAVLALMMNLTQHPEEATRWLKSKLHKAQGVSDKEIQGLIANLAAEDFSKRRAANAELIKFGEIAEGALRLALKQNSGLEAKRRLESLLERIELSDLHFPSPSTRIVRSLCVLENMDRPEAWKLLEELAQGDTRARQTRHAQAALGRRKEGS